MIVQIIGVGKVGSAIAFGLLQEGDADEIIISDNDIARLKGEYYDLKTAGEIFNKSTELTMTTEVRYADIYIFCNGNNTQGNGDRVKLEAQNLGKTIDSVEECSLVNRNAWLIMVNNPTHFLSQKAMEFSYRVLPMGARVDDARKELSNNIGTHEQLQHTDIYKETLENKGYSNFPVVAEVIEVINKLKYGFY